MTTYNPLHLLPLPPHPTDPKPFPTALTVDPFSDILWVGSSSGLVSALCSPLSLTPNVRFPAHGHNAPVFMGSRGVNRIRVTDREIWTLTEGGVGGRKRSGLGKWSVSDPTRGLRSMSPNPTNSHEVLAGGVSGLMLANTSRGDIVRRVDTSSAVLHLAPSQRNVFAASLSGQISVLDPRTGFRAASSISPVQAHTGGLNGADVQGNLVCTWGWTHMSGHPLPDPLVRLYDIRTLRALPPISFPAGPAFCLLHPTDPSKVVISSQQGMLQVVDMAGTPGQFQQLDVSSYLTSMALSPTGEYIVFGDADGQVHLWTTQDTSDTSAGLAPFNGFDGIKPEWPDTPEPPPSIAWDDHTPLNVIGMPHYSEPLLSNVTIADYATPSSPFFNPPEPIPNSVLTTMKMVDFVGYATTPRELRGKRYVRPARTAHGRSTTAGRRASTPRFRSDKDRQARPSISGELDEELLPGQVPKRYRKVEIKYSKFGIEDFDFGFYNRTEYSGLETDILNSYTNALLQALHYVAPFRTVAKGHICVECKKEHCLLCEAGFLFRMLEDARGINCQASNFSRAFSATPQASALGLMDDNDNASTPYGPLIQNFNRWLLSTLSTESVVERTTFNIRPKDLANLSVSSPSALDQLLGIDLKITNTCQACGLVTARESMIQAVDLVHTKTPQPFPELLRSSIMRETSTKATCNQCKQFAPLLSQRTLRSALPSVISVNTAITPETFDHWKNAGDQRYLSSSIALQTSSDRGNNQGEEYQIRAVVAQIQEDDQPSHLVAFAKTPTGWVMFNDFLVRPVSEDEVFSIPDRWKTPSIIILEKTVSQLDFSAVPTELNPQILSRDVSIAWNRRKNVIKHKVLNPTEVPKAGTLISIDAEFVALQQEEMEFRSDGTKNILRPSHMSLARVSVLRGQDPAEGVPFIDDYIHTSETVVDFLTEFSGIKNGDLEPNSSPHTLVPLKIAYKKLRLLVDLGCIFIGHGLSKDFRTINIFVPPEQVMDTVFLYSMPGQKRKLSLRYLSWFLLKKDIQTASHDSIEDARHALLLFKLWQDFEAQDRLEDVMEDIFAEGQKHGFKPPQDKTASPLPPSKAPRAQQGAGGRGSAPPPPQPRWGDGHGRESSGQGRRHR